MIKFERKNNNQVKNMITVRLKLKDEKYYSLADDAFIKANMKKEDIGLYVGDKDTYCSSFLALRSLILNNDFVKNVDSFTRDCDDGDGEENLMGEYYDFLIQEGEIHA